MNPPRIPQRILSFINRKKVRDNFDGDMIEFYEELLKTSGKREADRWFWRETLKSIPASLRNNIFSGGMMISNYAKVIFRNMKNQKLFSFINIFGLALGMSICLIALMFIAYELSFDTYHENADNIYRVTRRYETPNGYNPHFARCPEGWVNNLSSEFPEVKSLVRFQWTPSVNLKVGEEKFRSFKWYFTDPEVFDIFSFPLLRGNSHSALSLPNSVVITEAIANKYFGNEDPLGKVIQMLDETSGNSINYNITGVMKNLPPNSHFNIEYLVSYPNEEARNGWAWVYLLLEPGTIISELEGKLPEFIRKYGGEEAAQTGFLHLQPLKDIHLYSRLDREIELNGDIETIYIFSGVGLLALLIASFNFMNLSTAKSLKRSKEVGIRKVLGAFKKELVNYFLWESVIYSLMSFGLALVILVISLPFLEYLFSYNISFDFKYYAPLIGLFALVSLINGIVSGIYPSLVLASFSPITAFNKGNKIRGIRQNINNMIRKLLVVVQFVISIVLIISTLFIYDQFQFITNKKLGFNKQQVMAIKNVARVDQVKYPLFKNLLEGVTGIQGVTATMDIPSMDILDMGYTVVEGVHTGDESDILALLSVDDNYLQVMDMTLKTGAYFSQKNRSERTSRVLNLSEMQQIIAEEEYSFVINESAVKKLGWNSADLALGKELNWSNNAFSLRGKIVGVVNDFYYASLRLNVRPLILVNEPLWLSNYLVKINSGDIKGTVEAISSTWNTIYPNSPMEYDFLEDLFANIYRSEERMGNLMTLFSALAIFIAYLGLFGLVSYSTERRKKEVGVRKVMGASVLGVVILLGKEFAKWILIAIIIAVPVGYYLVSDWLENFAYRVEITWHSFVVAALVSMLIGLLTVCFQTIKAAYSNPIESIKYE